MKNIYLNRLKVNWMRSNGMQKGGMDCKVIKYLTYIVMLFTSLTLAKPQASEGVYEWASEIIESISAEAEDGDYSYMIEDLIRLAQNPININTANREELGKIFFLTDIQIENLLFHRYRNGNFYTIFEVQAVKGFDKKIIEMMEPLIFFGDDSVSDTPVKHIFKGDLFLRTRFTVETPKGFVKSNDEPAPYKGGKPLYYTRFEASPARNISIGLVAENDPGEPLFSKDIPTFDFVSGYISWKPDKALKQIIIGQYKISGGQGLVLKTGGMTSGKSSYAASIRNRNGGFRTGLSANESSGMSGILLSFGNENFSITPFLSVQKRDGRIAEDSLGNTYYTTLRKDGYHRTTSELDTRHNIREGVFGAQVKYFTKIFTYEVGHVEYHLEHPLQPELSYYNQFYFNGKQNGNTWAAIEGGIKNIFLFSEIAFNFNETTTPAVWIGVLTSPFNRLNWALSYRNIPREFQAPLGAPFAESPQGSGESGFYSGVDIELPNWFTLSAYIDWFKFKWLRYQIKSPSSGYDGAATLTYKPNRVWETSLRFRHKEKDVNMVTDNMTYPIVTRGQNQLRWQSKISPVSPLSFTTRIDWNIVKIEGKDNTKGFYISQDIRYQHHSDKWYILLRYGLVDANDYENRFYIYEPDVLYSFNVPLYYGHGYRVIAMAKYTVIPKLDVWVRYSRWNYYNRESIGSGNNMIDSNVSNEFRIQIRKRF